MHTCTYKRPQEASVWMGTEKLVGFEKSVRAVQVKSKFLSDKCTARSSGLVEAHLGQLPPPLAHTSTTWQDGCEPQLSIATSQGAASASTCWNV